MYLQCPHCGGTLLTLSESMNVASPSSLAEKLKAAVTAVKEVVAPDCDCPDFKLAAAEWLRTRERRVADDTLRTYREFVVALNRYFGSKCTGKITIADVRVYQAERRAKVGAERINHEIGILKQVLGKKLWAPIAEEYERLPQKQSDVGQALSRKAHQRLFAAALAEPRWHRVYLAAVIAINTTSGRRELLTLRVKDLDIDRKMLHVNRGKNRFRQRDIPLNKVAFLAAKELLKRAKQLGSVDPNHYIFPYFDRAQNAYDPLRHSPNFRDPWRALTRSVGMKGLRFHDLRHTAITNLLENGTPEAVVMELSGHVERRTLLRYSHQRIQAKRTGVRKLERTVKKPVQKEAKPLKAESQK